MGRDFIPEADARARIWLRSFANNIAAAPARYALTFAQSASIGAVVDRFEAALAVSSSPATRTRGTVTDTHDARHIAKQLCRQYAAIIKHNAGIDDGDKIAIGVPPINPARTKRKAPQTSPLLKILGGLPSVHVLRYNDSTTPQSRAIPFGATHLQLFHGVGDARSALSQATFCGCYTKNPMRISYDAADAGKTATYYARWMSQRGEFGPWSLPVSFTIAA